jgi:hypothetical protein
MTLTRRAVLALSGVALTGSLAGCTGAAPADDSATDTDTPTPTEMPDGTATDGGLPGSDDDSGAGGTRPEGTGGPGVTIVAVDDAPDLPVRPSVELVREAATADHPPQLRTTLTNTTDSPVRVGEGRAVHFEYVDDEAGQLILLPADGDYPAEPDCWRLTEGLAITEEYRTFEILPDEPSSRLVDLYGAATDEDSCLPVGEYRFETTVAVVSEGGDSEQSARWGFSVLLE